MCHPERSEGSAFTFAVAFHPLTKKSRVPHMPAVGMWDAKISAPLPCTSCTEANSSLALERKPTRRSYRRTSCHSERSEESAFVFAFRPVGRGFIPGIKANKNEWLSPGKLTLHKCVILSEVRCKAPNAVEGSAVAFDVAFV
jgi:hypothetical protein